MKNVAIAMNLKGNNFFLEVLGVDAQFKRPATIGCLLQWIKV